MAYTVRKADSQQACSNVAEASTSPDSSDDFLTTWIIDPDGNRIELVQWPAGHADGMTAADFAE